MRRSTLLLLGVAALVLAACEIRTDYDMFVDGDSSAMLVFDITYDGEAAQLFGPAEQFLEDEIEEDVGEEIDGVTLLSAEADSSDPDEQRVTATFEAEDGDAFDRLVDDLFPGSSFVNTEGDTWELNLRPDEDVAEDFDDEFPLDEFGLDFISGEVRLNHEGSQVSMSGGESGDGNLVLWDPYGPDSLEIVMDLSGDTPPAAAEEAEEPAEEPEEVEDPADEAEEPEEEEVEEPAEEAEDDLAEEDGDPAAAVGEDDDGISTLVLVALAVGVLLLLLLIIFLVVRSRGKKQQADAAAQEPVGAGVGAGAAGGTWEQQGTDQWGQNQYGQQQYAPGWDQQQAGQWEQPQQPPGQWDQTQAMQPPATSSDQPQAGQWDQPQSGAARSPEDKAPPTDPQPRGGPPSAPPPTPGESRTPPQDDGRAQPPQPPPPPPSG